MRDRDRGASRKDKSKTLDGLIAVLGHHRKHGIRLLAECTDKAGLYGNRRIYDKAAREVAILIWAASDRNRVSGDQARPDG